MIEHVFDDMFLASLDRLDAALDELTGHDLSALDPSTLALAFQRLEVHSRRRDSVEHGWWSEIDPVGSPSKPAAGPRRPICRACPTSRPSDARQRVECARNLAPGRTLTGECTPVIFPGVAAAEADGVLSRAHARVITTTIDKLPDAVAAEWDRTVEADLVDRATVLNPNQLAIYARKLAYALDQDGVLADEEYRDRTRHLSVAQRPDGTVFGDFDLTAPCGEALLTMLDSLAAPRPEADGIKDTRTTGQRNHDALLDGLNRLLVDGGLPTTGGVNATILLTMTEEQLQQRALDAEADGDAAAETDADDADSEGHEHAPHRPDAQLVRTGHGALISLAMALKIATDAQIIPIIFKGAKEIAAYGDTHRFATTNQRLALIARDKGCSFPGCTIPPAWCQTHHITEFQFTRRTSVDDLTLLCGYHHRTFEKLGWTCQMITGYPALDTPTLDQPRPNTAAEHRPHLTTGPAPHPTAAR